MVDFSFIIPTFNRIDSLLELLHSIAKMEIIDAKMEVIVVDDGSTDETSASLSSLSNLNPKFTFTYFTIPNGGPGFARNYGAKKANGKWLVFIDDDCVVPTSYFNDLCSSISNNKDCLVACGNVKGIKQNILSNYIDWTGIMQSPNDGCGGKLYFLTANAIVDKSLFFKLGGFDNAFRTASGEDVYLSQKIRNNSIQIIFFKNCIVYHKHRDTLVGIYQTCHSYGAGHYLIEQLSGTACKRSYFKILKHEFFQSIKKITFSKAFKYGIFYLPLDIIKAFAWTMGYNKAFDRNLDASVT